MKHYPLYTKETLPRDLVLANGAFPTAPTPLALLDRWSLNQEGYTLTCCDGAVNKLRRYTSILPDAVVGDLDSVSPALRALLGERVHRFPDQDTNDLTKTMHFLHNTRGHVPSPSSEQVEDVRTTSWLTSPSYLAMPHSPRSSSCSLTKATSSSSQSPLRSR